MTYAPVAGFLLRLVAEELVEAREATTASSFPTEQLDLLSAPVRLLARWASHLRRWQTEVSTSGDGTQAGTDSDVEVARQAVAPYAGPSSD
jgi:hypothetical protein